MNELKLKYIFKDRALLDLALTQSGANQKSNNERLEFVGDRVLGLTIASILYDTFPGESEGELARRHAVLVSTRTLAEIGMTLDLMKCVRHGHMTGGRVQHITANAMEAILGAVFIDGGYNAAHGVIAELWADYIMRDPNPPKDAKTRLQEVVQKIDNGNLPVYEYKMISGQPHSPVFEARVTAMGASASATGTSKRLAATAAAEDLLKILATEGKTIQNKNKQTETKTEE